MPDSIALTRIHTPEDYWNRMANAEGLLFDQYRNLIDNQPALAKLCLSKAQQLSDRYHEHWTINRKEYFG